MIEKHLSVNFYVSGVVQGTKLASFDPEIHIPPEIQDFIGKLQADPRYAYMHTIAMSDGDSYGSNLNGDVFTWDELLGTQGPEEAAKNPGEMKDICVPRYKTFEQSKFFKHHANSAYDDSFGDVPLAVINMPMRRIELIIRIAREDCDGHHGAPDVCDKLDNGGVVAVSMGTRIGSEACSYCNHENEFISQRCSHLANQMGEIMPNGVKVYAINFKPRFFDISKVTIPADPIAMSLSKVAAFMPKISAPNKAADVKTASCLWRQKWSEIFKTTPADCVEKLTAPPGEPIATAPSEFTDDELKSAAATGTLDEIVSTATAMGIVLSPTEFAKLAALYGHEVIDEVDFSGLDILRPNYSALSVFKEKFAERSGYCIPVHGGGWHPTKLAEAGHDDISDLYAFYRTCVGAVAFSDLSKCANANQALRQLAKGHDVMDAATYLAHAGF